MGLAEFPARVSEVGSEPSSSGDAKDLDTAGGPGPCLVMGGQKVVAELLSSEDGHRQLATGFLVKPKRVEDQLGEGPGGGLLPCPGVPLHMEVSHSHLLAALQSPRAAEAA